MPAYSFKERFVPMVKDKSKPHTIRNFRKSLPKIGQYAHLYFGMRTKWCKKLVDPSPAITAVGIIHIEKSGRVFLINTSRLTPFAINKMIATGKFPKYLKKDPLCNAAKDRLAWRDGFRLEGSTSCYDQGSFDLMLKWWKQTHELPFTGTITYWQDEPDFYDLPF